MDKQRQPSKQREGEKGAAAAAAPTRLQKQAPTRLQLDRGSLLPIPLLTPLFLTSPPPLAYEDAHAAGDHEAGANVQAPASMSWIGWWHPAAAAAAAAASVAEPPAATEPLFCQWQPEEKEERKKRLAACSINEERWQPGAPSGSAEPKPTTLPKQTTLPSFFQSQCMIRTL